MASDPHDRWLFLLAVAPLPLACADDAPDPVAEGTAGTTAAPTSSTTDEPEGSTSITTTGLDGTSSSGGSDTAVVTDGSSSSSDGTTMMVDPTTGSSSEEGSSSTGEPMGLCELWGENQAMCYGYYGNAAYYTNQCYDYVLNYLDPMCGVPASALYLCQAAGCFANCGTEYEDLQECNELVQYMELGCDMLPIVPAVGPVLPQCTTFIDQVEVCTAAGFYIPFFSGIVMYSPAYADYYCAQGFVIVSGYVPQVLGDPCGGAYEELLTCLTALPCNELELAVFDGGGACQAQHDAVTCRCELGP